MKKCTAKCTLLIVGVTLHNFHLF